MWSHCWQASDSSFTKELHEQTKLSLKYAMPSVHGGVVHILHQANLNDNIAIAASAHDLFCSVETVLSVQLTLTDYIYNL